MGKSSRGSTLGYRGERGPNNSRSSRFNSKIGSRGPDGSNILTGLNLLCSIRSNSLVLICVEVRLCRPSLRGAKEGLLVQKLKTYNLFEYWIRLYCVRSGISVALEYPQ